MDLGFRFSRFLVGLPQFFVRAVVTGDGFLGLVRLNIVVSRGKGLAQFLCRSCASGVSCWALDSFRRFLFERHEVKFFVELARLGRLHDYRGRFRTKCVIKWILPSGTPPLLPSPPGGRPPCQPKKQKK